MGERKFHKTLFAGAAAALLGASEMSAEAKPPVQPLEPETTEQTEKAAMPEFEKQMTYHSVEAAAKGYVACLAVWNECKVEESLALVHYSPTATVGTDVRSSVVFDERVDSYSESREVSWDSAERAVFARAVGQLEYSGYISKDYTDTVSTKNFHVKEVTQLSQESGRKTADQRVFVITGLGGRKKPD